MTRTEEERKAERESFEEAARPLIKWLAENVNPHHVAVVTSTTAQLLQGQIAVKDESFLRD